MQQNKSKALPKNELERLIDLTLLEDGARKRGYKHIAGVDEAGRGPLAGPVVAAAACIPEGVFFAGINDSKLLTPLKRKSLFEELIARPDIQYSIAIVDEKEIDEINILRATLKAMERAVSQLKVAPDFILIDGTHGFGGAISTETVIQGDRRSQSIAAASILAKESRDRIMLEYHKKYPEYGFDKHKGYGTKVHREALLRYGPCPIHRRSFQFNAK